MIERLILRSFFFELLPLLLVQAGILYELKKEGGRWRGWAAAGIVWAMALALLGNAAGALALYGIGVDSEVSRLIARMGGAVSVWLFASAPAYGIYLIGGWVRRRVPAGVSTERRQLLRSATVAAVATPFAAMAYGIAVGRVDFRVREVALKIPGLHPDLEGLRIVHLSDIHLGEFLSARELERAIDLANGLRPHLAIMTGDLISRPGDPMELCVQHLARVRADAGMVGCLGNHEMYARVEAQVKAEAAKRGIPFLREENRELRFGQARLNIGGVDYQRFGPREEYLKGAEKLLAGGAFNLLLSHNPDVFPAAARQGWDLTLSGHTHGGQVTVEIVEQNLNVMRFFTPYVAGEYHLGRAGCYVTRGIGTVGLPARVGVPPEITLLRLGKA